MGGGSHNNTHSKRGNNPLRLRTGFPSDLRAPAQVFYRGDSSNVRLIKRLMKVHQGNDCPHPQLGVVPQSAGANKLIHIPSGDNFSPEPTI